MGAPAREGETDAEHAEGRTCPVCNQWKPQRAFSYGWRAWRRAPACRRCWIRIREVWSSRLGSRATHPLPPTCLCCDRPRHRRWEGFWPYCRVCIRVVHAILYDVKLFPRLRCCSICDKHLGRAGVCPACALDVNPYRRAVLDADGPVTSAELAAEIGVTRRSVLREAPKYLRRLPGDGGRPTRWTL